MAWEPEYHDVDLAPFGYPGVVVTGVVNIPAPLVRETVGMLHRVAELGALDAVGAVLERYYKLLAMWFREVQNGEEVFAADTPAAVQAFEENEDWAVLGIALRELIGERERRRAAAARKFRETDG